MDAFRRQMDRLFDEMTSDHALTPQWGQFPIELNDADNNLELTGLKQSLS